MGRADMAKGDSGRIVIEIDPDLKRRLHSALALKSQSLKDWFVAAANTYLKKQMNDDAPKSKGAKTMPRPKHGKLS